MRVAEIFRSVQGEGLLTGVESVFVARAAATCRCGYCDTPYASWTPEGEELSVPEILDRVELLNPIDGPKGTVPFSLAKIGTVPAQNRDRPPRSATWCSPAASRCSSRN